LSESRKFIRQPFDKKVLLHKNKKNMEKQNNNMVTGRLTRLMYQLLNFFLYIFSGENLFVCV